VKGLGGGLPGAAAMVVQVCQSLPHFGLVRAELCVV
jgi:hypothetical protein